MTRHWSRCRGCSFPPFLYLTAFALGWLLHWLAPFQAMPAAVARVPRWL